jgi:phytanoyl-CoA hydroxylase
VLPERPARDRVRDVVFASILANQGSALVNPIATESETIRLTMPTGEAEPPLYRSRYGGLWVDRRDAHEILEARLASSDVTDADAEVLAHYIDYGYVVFPKATDESVIDEYLDFFESAWDVSPNPLYLTHKLQVVPMEGKYRDLVAKVSDVHSYFPRSGELIFPVPVLRFLTQIYERPPVAFQTMTMRKGSEEALHIDTGPLSLTEPMTMAASWVALENVQTGSGEFMYVPGSHRAPERLHYGTDKAHSGDYVEYNKVLKSSLQWSQQQGFETQSFLASKGDVLIWHADLLHGGALIQDQSRTRKSLVAHFMPLGVMPTFFNCAEVRAIPYPGGGYCTDRLLHDTTPRQQPGGNTAVGTEDGAQLRPIDAWRSWVPLSLRKRVPPSIGAWARAHLQSLRK